MADDAPPLGERFSQVYLRMGGALADSERMRQRILAFFGELVGRGPTYPVANVIHAELGVTVPVGANGYRWDRFVLECQLRDLLDFITLVWRVAGHVGIDRNRWVSRIRRIFSEENVSYTIDEQGGVHFAVDAEFARNRTSTVAALGNARYAGALMALRAGYAALDQHPPDGKSAIRSIFEAVEILFRLVCPRAPRIGSTEIRDHLTPLVANKLQADPIAGRAALKMLRSIGEWVDGAHFYRHGQGVPEPVQPPLDLTVMTVTTGTSYLRWLAELDQANQSSIPSQE